MHLINVTPQGITATTLGSTEVVTLERDPHREAYRDAAGNYYRLDGPRVVQITGGIPPLSWTSRYHRSNFNRRAA